MKRMSKEQLIELIKSMGLNKEDFYILSTSALVLRNLFDTAGDLDIVVSPVGLVNLKEKFDVIQKENGWYQVSDKIECLERKKELWSFEDIGDYYLEDLNTYFKYLEQSNREKDKIKYQIVKKELKR